MTAERVLQLAAQAGFDLAGIAPAEAPPDARHFESWLDAGMHGSMAWLERDRERIVAPRRVIPAARSILVVGLAHSRAAVEAPGGGRVARYAAGRDYHNVMIRRLRKLGKSLAREGLTDDWRGIVDAGPVLERSHAARAGVGFASKAANLLHPRFGPWFFLGELLLEADLEPTAAPFQGSCGTCTACLDACPTQAIVAPGRVDARLCISYQTIEHRGPTPRELRASHGPWAFGCDVCSEVCPWGSDAPDLAERFGLHPELQQDRSETRDDAPTMISWLTQREGFEARFQGSPLRRPGREGLARNAAIVLGNLPSDRGRGALLEALDFDPSALVREAAAWGLARGHGSEPTARAALERAAAREPEPEAAQGMAASLAGDL